MENNKLVFHMPKENKEDFQSIMDNVDLDEIRKAEENNKMRGFKRTQSWGDSGILNNLDFDNTPRKLIHLDNMVYAFVCEIDGDIVLWSKRVTQNMSMKDWTEVTSLLDVPVFVYQHLKKYAVSVGWIDEDVHDWLI
mgnify:CR=1 FL=1